MSWIAWVAILVAWPLIGLGVAYLFGRFTHRGEVYGNAGELAPPVITYMRRTKPIRLSPRAHSKSRGEAASGRRVH